MDDHHAEFPYGAQIHLLFPAFSAQELHDVENVLSLLIFRHFLVAQHLPQVLLNVPGNGRHRRICRLVFERILQMDGHLLDQ